eukprot:SAG22_NODE_163_length_16829_cov_9.946204_9_plen_220_part_00
MAEVAHTWWDESVSHVYLTAEQAAAAGLSKGYREFVMPGLTAGVDPLEALYKAVGQPTATVKAMVCDMTAEPEPAAAPAAAAAEEDDGEIDLWGDEDDEEAEEANEARLKAIADAHKAKKAAAGKLKAVVNKSSVVLDVKPWDDETDLKAMETAVRAIAMEGLEWQASQLEDIGFGIKKLRIMVQIVDDLVSVDEDIVAPICEIEDHVQSCDIFAFNKV